MWKYLHRLIYSGVLQSAQFYLFMWLFWRTPSTLKIAKSSPPLVCARLVPYVDKAPLPLRIYADKLLKGENQSMSAHVQFLLVNHTFYFGRYWFSAFAKLLKIKKPVFCFDGSDWLPIKCLTRDGNQTYPD